MILIIFGIALLVLLIGTITDFRSREVPDFVNYSLITLGFAINLIFSLTYNDWNYIINSAAGFIVFLIIALIMFYTGQWGGGDSKMLMGLGALLGLDITFKSMFLLNFFFNMLIIGGIWGLLWAVALAIKNRKKFIRSYNKMFKNKLLLNTKRLLTVVLPSIAIVLFISIEETFFRYSSAGLSIFVLLIFYLIIFIKAIENSCMFKRVLPDQLTEGDWIVKDIKYQGKTITGPKDLGIEKKQINILKKLYKQNNKGCKKSIECI